MKTIRKHLPATALLLAVLSGLGLLLSGPGCRLEIWSLKFGFTLFQFSAFGGVAAVVLSLAALLMSRRERRCIIFGSLSLVLGALAAWIPWHQLQIVKSLPYIHDITTDTEHPPEFVAILPLRKDAPNTATYAGAELAAQQQKTYADLKPLLLNLPVAQAYARALSVAQKMNWEIVANDASVGRIEATDTTFWFGFKDDIVVRVSASDEGRSRIDVRSVSRVGQSDVGTNAARIRRYLAALRALP